MKLSEIKTGVEYGAVDRGQVNHTPRQVSVLGIETVEEKHYRTYEGTWQTRNVKKVKVRFLDDVQRNWGNPIEAAVKNSEKLIAAREIVAEWKKLAGPIREKAEQEQREKDEKAAMTKRLAAVLGKRPSRLEAWVSVHGWRGMYIEIHGNELEKLLSLAEKGKAA